MQQPARVYHAAPQLWAGATLGNENQATMQAHIAWLVATGITVVIDLTTPADECVSYAQVLAAHAPHITRWQFPIRDMGTPSPALMLAILDTISHAVTHGAHVYVHCWGGIGRSGTVVACWFVRHGMHGDDALAHLQAVRRDIDRSAPETPAQHDFVRRWQEPTAVHAATMRQIRDRARGAMLGLAVGDAVGTTLEFQRPGTFTPISDMVGGGPFALPVGAWTDDTSMMLCLAESLLVCGGFDATDQMQRYVRWHETGYFSVTGRCFDIGSTVLGSLMRFRRTGDPFAGDPHPMSAGNGSLMRLAPIAVRYLADDQLPHYARESSRTTHATATALDACEVAARLMAAAMRGANKDALFALVHQLSTHPAYHTDIRHVLAGSYRRQPPDIRGTGYVVNSLDAALWALYYHDDFRSGALAAANLGEDADTTAAIYGQLAGALYGESGIVAEWRAKLINAIDMSWRADELLGAGWSDMLMRDA